MRTVDFGEGISDIQETPIVVGESVQMANGSIRRVTTGGVLGVRLVLSNFDNGPLLRELRSLDTHLKRGYPVGFAFDVDKMWAGFARNTIAAGQLLLHTRARNEWRSAYGGPMMPSPGDELVLESAAPEGWREWCVVSDTIFAGASSRLRFTEGTRYNHTRQPILIREEGSYPLLMLPEGLREDLLTHTYQRTWTWQVTLWQDNHAIAAVWEAGGDALQRDGSRLTTPTQLARDLVPR